MIRPDKCPRCLGPVVMVEYDYSSPEHYDGISEYACISPTCGWRIGRWCGQELKKGEIERRYCDGRVHPKVYEENRNNEPLAEAIAAEDQE